MTLAEFEQRMIALADRTENNLGVTMKRTSFRAFVQSVRGTPVDTGRARSNYRIAFGSRSTGVREPFSPGSRLGIGESTNARGAETEARRTLRSIPNNRVVRTRIVQSNPLSYVEGLNNGNSKQAAGGFIERAANAARRVPSEAFTLRRKLKF